ncbi:formylglycine-generating enzyme [Azospirillaceae bacterium]
MDVGELVWTGVDLVLDRGLGAVGSLTIGRAKAILKKVSDHFTLSSKDLAIAFQGSFGKGVEAVALGVAPAGWLGGILSKPDRLLSSKLAKEYAQGIEAKYVLPFIAARRLSDEDARQCRAETVKACRALAKRAADVLPTDAFPDGSAVVGLLRGSRRDDLSQLIMTQIGQAGVILSTDVAALLCHDGFIGDVMLFFVQESFRSNARVQATLNMLRQEAVWAEVERSSDVLERLGAEFGRFREMLSGDGAALSAALDTVEEKLTAELRTIGDGVSAIGGQNDEILGLVRDLHAMLQAQGRNSVVTVESGLTPLALTGGGTKLLDRTRSLLRANRSATALLPGAANTIAATLVATGDDAQVTEAERLLERTLDETSDPVERAQVAHNLYNVRLLRRDFNGALGPLQMALTIDAAKYAPFDAGKYRLLRILGAGGMGCVFLCLELVRQRKVAIKTLWQCPSGSIDKVFSELIAMDEVGGKTVPKSIDYGFGSGTKTPYIVMEHLDGFLDGEAWLAKYGPLTIEETASVGLHVARTLAVAHGRTVKGKPAPIPHLDIKPANLMLARRDGVFAVKIIDWGLSQVGKPIGATIATMAATRAGATQFGRFVMGTWDYAPPEQMGKEELGRPGPKSDVYALGKTLYRLATASDPHTPSLKRLKALAALGDLIQECLESDPSDRPEASGLIEVLEKMVPADKDKASEAEPRKLVSSSPISISEDASLKIELAFWETIKDSRNAEDFEDYLEKYPNGYFLGFVKRRLEDFTALIKASSKGDLVAVRRLLTAASVDVNATDENNNTALLLASQNGYIEVVEALLAADADVEARDNYGKTALLLASQNGYIEVVEALLAADADVEARNNYGKTALLLASQNGYAEVVEALLAADADVEAKDNCDNTALMWASYKGHIRAVEALLAADADVEAKDDGGNTALMWATQEGHISVMRVLQPSVQLISGDWPKPGAVFRDFSKDGGVCLDCPEMVVIPKGMFMMGSTKEERAQLKSYTLWAIKDNMFEEQAKWESPQHRVTIGYSFAVGKYPVTVGEFRRFIEATKHRLEGGAWKWNGAVREFDAEMNWLNPGFVQTDVHPVTCVNWDHAQLYVQWLSRKTGQTYRLLSEAEWEYVARAGTTTPFWTGSTITPDQANYDGNYTYNNGPKGVYRKKTTEVGSFKPNPFGLYDTAGNVWEWVEDCWNDNYNGAPTDGDAWQGGDCGCRVVRGCSWGGYPRDLRSARRDWLDSANRFNYIGFRVARTIST